MILVMVVVIVCVCSVCRVKSSHRHSTNMPPSLGGPEIDNVVVAAFAALVWHTPALRQQISRHGSQNIVSV